MTYLNTSSIQYSVQSSIQKEKNLMKTKATLITLVAATLLTACTAVVAQPEPQPEAQPEPEVYALQFGTHVAAGMAEQDVFIEREAGSGKVMRILPGEESETLDLPIYAAASNVGHDLFGTSESPVGPFEKGLSLEMTMGEWLAGTAQGTYTVTGDRAKLDFTAEKLVPNGVYTVWCARVSPPPADSSVDKPCGAVDGSQNGFVADAYGNASFTLELPTLPATSAETMTVIALAYHSDGKTYGELPGDFGFNSHVQLAAVITTPESR
jgi:hypothetical protein